eukprot:gene45666-52779_t
MYDCLTKCGACEEGLICNGTTAFAAIEEYWRTPVGYKAFPCKPLNCPGAKQITAPDRITNVWDKSGFLGPLPGTATNPFPERRRAHALAAAATPEQKGEHR